MAIAEGWLEGFPGAIFKPGSKAEPHPEQGLTLTGTPCRKRLKLKLPDKCDDPDVGLASMPNVFGGFVKE